MLYLQKVEHLAGFLGTSASRLRKVTDDLSPFVKPKIIPRPSEPDNPRVVYNVIGVARRFQNVLLREVLHPKHRPSIHSHGGIRGRSIKTNAGPHAKSVFVYCTDIADCYPSIHYSRVYRLFCDDFKCSPAVSKICTQLCTFKYHLALGLITSPILADCILLKADRRIATMCLKHGLVYTRFVDDLTISGPFDVESGSFAKLVAEILRCYGFRIKQSKESFGRLSDGELITKLRIHRGRLDVQTKYLDLIAQQMDDGIRLSKGDTPLGDYYTASQVLGKIRFVNWINPGRRSELFRKYRSVDWRAAEAEALRRGIITLA